MNEIVNTDYVTIVRKKGDSYIQEEISTRKMLPNSGTNGQNDCDSFSSSTFSLKQIYFTHVQCILNLLGAPLSNQSALKRFDTIIIDN